MSKVAYDLSKTPSGAAKDFGMLVDSLWGAIDGLPEDTEKHRAEQIASGAVGGFHKAISVSDEQREHMLNKVREQLTELERLLAGQKMMFQSASKRVAVRFAAQNVTETFKKLFEICDSIDSIIEGDALRRLGIKPKPSAPSKRVKAPKTYAKAQDEILAALKSKGWVVAAHLKIPHATSPSGNFRYWFKPQAIYASSGARVTQMGEARSIFSKDYRFEDIGEFANGLEAYAKKHGG